MDNVSHLLQSVISDTKVNRTALHVYTIIAMSPLDRRDTSSSGHVISQDDLIRMAKVSRSSIYRALRLLQRRGYLTIHMVGNERHYLLMNQPAMRG